MKKMNLTHDELYQIFANVLFEQPKYIEEKYAERPKTITGSFMLYPGDKIVTKDGIFYIQEKKEIPCKNFPIVTIFKPHDPEPYSKLVQPPTGKRIVCSGNYSDFLSDLAIAIRANSVSQSVAKDIVENVSVRKSLKIGIRAEDPKRIENKAQRAFRTLGITKKKICEDTIRDIHGVFMKYLGDISLPSIFYYIARIFIACGMAKGTDIRKTAKSLYVGYKHVIKK